MFRRGKQTRVMMGGGGMWCCRDNGEVEGEVEFDWGSKG